MTNFIWGFAAGVVVSFVTYHLWAKLALRAKVEQELSEGANAIAKKL